MLKQITRIIVLFFFVFSNSLAFSASQLGYGKTRCSVFNAVQKEGGAMLEGIDSWALGYLSGLNQAATTSGQGDRLRAQQPDRVGAYIRTYCSANSNQTIATAVHSLWSSVKRK